MFGGFGFPGIPGYPGGGSVFESRYRAMPVAFIDKQSAEYGDKIIMPPSALDQLGTPLPGIKSERLRQATKS